MKVQLPDESQLELPDGASGLDAARAIGPKLAEQAVLAKVNGEPVGYLQSWWEPDPPKRGGLDGFLIPSARGRGIMPTVARQLASDLLRQGWTEVTVDPYEWNGSAVRAWERAGFVEASRHPADAEHTTPWVLMRFTCC